MERQAYGKRFLLAFVIATIIFASGFLISYMVSSYQYRAISASQETLRYNLLELEIQKKLIDCNGFNPYMFANEMDYAGSITEALEQRFGKTDSKVLEQKKIYSLIQTQHFLIVTESMKECNISLNTILFFYSNNGAYSDEAEKMGVILDSVKKRKEIMVYSFDFDIDSTTLKLLKEKYNVTNPNTIIINEKIKLENVQNVAEVEKYL